MPKSKIIYSCGGCSYESSKWLGKCPKCNEWNSFYEVQHSASALPKHKTNTKYLSKRWNEVKSETIKRFQTKWREVDRVLGGGAIEGSIILIGGEPGVGKSTLLMQILEKLVCESKKRGIYFSGEESISQIASRAKRLSISDDNFLLCNESSWENIKKELEILKPSFLVLDSIQTMSTDKIQSYSGSVSQVREVTLEVMNYAKASGVIIFLVGHITKGGEIAGPKILEHMVDTVIYFEAELTRQYRILRVIKNRFGNTNEIGVFEMKENGLAQLSSPPLCFISNNKMENLFGVALTCTVEGSRVIFIEVQALVVENKSGLGKRVVQGIDQKRLSMLIAIVEKYFQISMDLSDVYVNIASGGRISCGGIDLAIITAILSSYYKKMLPKNSIYLGELGLTGEVRNVSHFNLRLKEMLNFGYKRVICANVSDKLKKDFNSIKFIELPLITEIKKDL